MPVFAGWLAFLDHEIKLCCDLNYHLGCFYRFTADEVSKKCTVCDKEITPQKVTNLILDIPDNDVIIDIKMDPPRDRNDGILSIFMNWIHSLYEN